jgi:hypothetical protein
MMKTKIEPEVYLFKNWWKVASHGHPSGVNFWVAEKVNKTLSFDHPLSKTRIFRDKQSAVKYVEENINE